MLFGAAAIGLVLPFGAFTWPTTLHAWALVATLGVVCTLLPFWTWNAAQRYLPLSTLGVSAYFTWRQSCLIRMVWPRRPCR